jgi:hypothetical protein
MTAIVIGAAHKLLPMDIKQEAGALLERLTDNATFKRSLCRILLSTVRLRRATFSFLKIRLY